MGLADRLKKNLPAQSAQNVSDVNEHDRRDNVQRLYAAGIAKACPVKTPPVLHLEIDQDTQHSDYGGRREDAFFAHAFANYALGLLGLQEYHCKWKAILPGS